MTIKNKFIIFSFNMSDIPIKDNYSLSNCCTPVPDDEISGYYSHDNVIKVHKKTCENLKNVPSERLLSLLWNDILTVIKIFTPDKDFKTLDNTDFLILKHHADYGIDYSHVVARRIHIAKQEAFNRHKRLRDLGLIERVEPKIVQYRKGIVDNKWIKHRNHTYYDLTEKGNAYLAFYLINTGY